MGTRRDDELPALAPGSHDDTARRYLQVLGNGMLAIFPLPDASRVTIGRSRSCEIVIHHPSISRQHALLHLGDPPALEDLGGVNGTMVGDERLAPGTAVTVRPGDVFELGTLLAVLHDSGAPGHMRYVWPNAAFDARLSEECERSRRSGAGFALLRFSCDSEQAASVLVEALRLLVRSADVIGQHGPRSYQALLLDVDAADDRSVARLVSRLERCGVQARIGAAHFPRDGHTADELLARAGRLPGRTDRGDAGLAAATPTMQRLAREVERIAAGTISVLIQGETGAGKELLAERIHGSSPRCARPFLRLSCAALPESLLESELFGHERGAFTGAERAKPGLLETTDGGTVFLDEIGELPLALQVKLLRVLEERAVLRIGSVSVRPIDVRFVAATNRDLRAEVARGRFREDLYYRLAGATLLVPPLRERRAEIPGLAAGFVARAAADLERPAPAISAEALAILQDYWWPGNVRELRNVIERAVLLCEHGVITAAELPLEKMTEESPMQRLRRAAATPGAAAFDDDDDLAGSGATAVTRRPEAVTVVDAEAVDAKRRELDDLERARIVRVLEDCGGNQSRAARLLGMSRHTLMKRMTAYGITRPRAPGPKPRS